MKSTMEILIVFMSQKNYETLKEAGYVGDNLCQSKNETSKDCGLHVSVAVDTIAVTPLGSKGRKGPCGPLASTFLHEMIHLCYNLDLSAAPMPRSEQEKEAQQAECEVFGFNCRKR